MHLHPPLPPLNPPLGVSQEYNCECTCIPVTMVTSKEQDMILFTTAYVLHIPIEYIRRDWKMRILMCTYGTLTAVDKQICAGVLQISQLYYIILFFKHLREC